MLGLVDSSRDDLVDNRRSQQRVGDRVLRSDKISLGHGLSRTGEDGATGIQGLIASHRDSLTEARAVCDQPFDTGSPGNRAVDLQLNTDQVETPERKIQLGDGRDSRDVTGNRVGLPCTSGRGKCDVLTLKHTRCVDRIASGWTTVSSRNPLFVTGKPIRTGEEDTDPADQRVPHQVAVGITEQGDAARKGRDASGLRIGKSLGNKPVGLGRIERCHTSGNDRVRDVEPSHQGLVVRCAPHAIRTRMLNAVPIGVLDRKQIDRWSEPNTRREVASQSHRGDESGSAIGRGKCRGQ